ncbi:hypothetical protein [Spongiactinospora sp. TRM90649]|uniref:hypothetical protein n=1 Tax=Spongiactinospora sp. TRM90649 TaxID=3031114 RepID=UPI0023F93E67|nr:hypothetical protein [Spongiactinospora sp. TRM90649]MDF5755148.1 hypothetical protein [Spongiactinospora sp. TRM90649]
MGALTGEVCRLRLAVLGADPDRFTALAHFARDVRTAAPRSKRSSRSSSPTSRRRPALYRVALCG